MLNTRSIEMHAGATLDSGATLECRVDSTEFVDLWWRWAHTEFVVTVERAVLRELVRQGTEALSVLERFAEIDARGGEVGRARIHEGASAEYVTAGVRWRDRNAADGQSPA